MVDNWEVRQPTFQRSVFVLEHFQICLNEYMAKLSINKQIRIMLLAGGDLIESFNTPNLWSEEDLELIMGSFGCLIVERTGVDLKGFLLAHDIAYKHKDNIMIAKQYIHNDISSTKIRQVNERFR